MPLDVEIVTLWCEDALTCYCGIVNYECFSYENVWYTPNSIAST